MPEDHEDKIIAAALDAAKNHVQIADLVAGRIRVSKDGKLVCLNRFGDPDPTLTPSILAAVFRRGAGLPESEEPSAAVTTADPARAAADDEIVDLERRKALTNNPTMKKVFDDAIKERQAPPAPPPPGLSQRDRDILKARQQVDHWAQKAPGQLSHQMAQTTLARLVEGTSAPAKNPWCRASLNLTEQMRIAKSDPALAARLEAEAKAAA